MSKPLKQDQPSLQILVTEALEEVKAQNITIIDVQDITSVTSTMIIASGTSKLHIKSLAENVAKHCKACGYSPLGVEGQNNSEWVLVDLGDIIVHLMMAATRQFYDLESLWQVAPCNNEASCI